MNLKHLTLKCFGLKCFSFVFAIFLPIFSFAAQFEQGNHYIVVAENKTAKAEVREYFSYYCPACRSFEAYLPEIKKSLPATVPLKKTHVDFMRNTTADIQFMLSKALIIAEKTGIADNFSPAMFGYLQTRRAKINSEKDVRSVFVLSGGDGAIFDKSINSFSIVSTAKRNKKLQDILSTKRQLKSVPTLVVNGKYLINAKSLNQNNFITEYKQLVSFLLAK